MWQMFVELLKRNHKRDVKTDKYHLNRLALTFGAIKPPSPKDYQWTDYIKVLNLALEKLPTHDQAKKKQS